jgi:CheY-like chemotaxis protein
MEPRPVTILVAEDDPDDRLFTKSALAKSRLANDLRFVEDGQELMDYLRGVGDYADPERAPRPGLILLDINMPRKDGISALKEIKQSPELRSIPVVILTTSRAERDIVESYELGVNSFISKPVTFDQLVSVMQAVARYWFQIVELPKKTRAQGEDA